MVRANPEECEKIRRIGKDLHGNDILIRVSCGRDTFEKKINSDFNKKMSIQTVENSLETNCKKSGRLTRND